MDATVLLMDIQRAVHAADSVDALALIAANDTRHLLPCSQAVLLDARSGRHRLLAISHLAGVERHTPFSDWMESLAGHLAARFPGGASRPVSIADAAGPTQEHWTEFSPPHGLWIPLIAPDGERMGALWLTRDAPWTTEEATLAEHLASTYAMAWRALAPRSLGMRLGLFVKKRRVWALCLAGLVAVMLAPVRLSVLATCEVAARGALPVTAPIDGIVQRIPVQSHQAVRPNDVLVQFENTQQRGHTAVAERTLRVARAELHKASQAAFTDQDSRARLAELSAQVDLRAAELEHARSEQQRVTVRAKRAGVAVITDPASWEGRPVRVGEQIFEIADPADIELAIDLPVTDALVIQPGAEVRVFLDSDPLDPRAARIVRASYAPEMTPYGYPAYRLIARFDPDGALPRIGLRGTAKIYGPETTLFYFLFRRPITALRQTLGW